MRKLTSYLILPILFVAGFATMALAQALPEEPILDLAKPVVDAVLAGNYWLGAAGALVFLTTAAYRYLPKYKSFAWLATGWGRALAVFLVAYGGALAALLVGAATMSPALAYGALKTAVTAAGGYSVLKATLYPLLLLLQDKAPAWAKPLFHLATWVFRNGDPEAKAKEAGDAAVEANPPEGAAGVVGEPGELE